MFRPLLLLVTAFALLPPAGCRKKPAPRADATVEEPARAASFLHMAAPTANTQLIRGFYPLEAAGWRWTARRFAVHLPPPPNAAQGATLELRFALPAVVMNELKSVTLSATVNGIPLPKQTYRQAGDGLYKQAVPAAALKGDAAIIEFELDKAFGPSGQDQRELGVIAVAVGFPKT